MHFQAYYSLVLTANVASGESVLVQAGWTSVGQAAIALALSFECTVFTTVSNNEQAMFIKQKFPQVCITVVCSSVFIYVDRVFIYVKLILE